MSVPIAQRSFAAGEITPAMYARTDVVKYETGLRTMRNFISMRHGGATQRPGTQYIGTTLNGGAAVRLIPFIFNATGNGQSYVLEFGNLYVAFYQNGANVISGGNPYLVTTPYVQADLSTLQFAETGDILTITHPNYAPRELKRLAATNWTLTAISFGASTFRNITLGISGTAGTDPQVSYYVTPVAADGEEGDAIVIATGTLLTLASPTAPVTLTITISVGVPGQKGASYFRVYKVSGVYNAGVSSPGIPGFIGTATAPISGGLSFSGNFIDNGITPDFTNTIPIDNPLFSTANNYPSTVGFIQQRRAFANTNNNPIGFWLSQPGLFSNFNFRSISIDSDPVIGAIAGAEINAIQHIAELKFMLLLTTGAEIYVQGNGNGVVTPSAINAATQSQYGSSPLRPLRVADTFLFNQSLGNVVRDLRYDFVTTGYNGSDVSIFSSHLLEGYSISDWDFQKIPDSIVWMVRSDGTLLSLTYLREQQMLAWSRHDFTNGSVENVCSIPENGQYYVYLSIQRVINGVTVRYIERMSSRIWSDPLTATYLDSFLSYDGRNVGSVTMRLSPVSGSFDTSSSAFQQSLNLSSSSAFFNSTMVGDQIFIQDDDFINTQGKEGNQVRCTILSYVNTTQVVVASNKVVPSEFQNMATVKWSRAVKEVTGLTHLVGQTVSVWADRFVVASPNNNNVTFQATVASDGSLTLDKCYSVIYVGLPMTADLETLDLETSFGESMIARRKRQHHLKAHFLNSRTVFAGFENPDEKRDNNNDDPLFELEELKLGTSRETYDAPPQLFTGQDYIHEITRWNKNGRIFMRNVDPTPLTILAVVPGGDYPAENPNAVRA